MKWIDTHSHLYLDRFDEDRDEMIGRAFDIGVEKIFLPNIDLQTVAAMNALSEKYPGRIYSMMGLHPCDVKSNWSAVLDEMKTLLDADDRYIAIGETGIDLYWDKSTLDMQQQALARQIQWAKDLQLPIVIHARESFDELFEVFDDLNDDNLSGVFHCFTGSLDQAKHIIDYGDFCLGIGGVATFKKSGLSEVLRDVSLDHIVLETDSPFLAPTPHRGKRNESAYVALVGEHLSGVYEMLPEKIAEITTANALRLFPKTS